VTFGIFSISEIMSAFQILLPLIGIVVGWMLKSATDLLTASHRERATRRKCTFYLLRAWKALLDYERFVSLVTSSQPDVEEYEPQRRSFAARFLSRIAEDKDSLVTIQAFRHSHLHANESNDRRQSQPGRLVVGLFISQ